MQHVCAVVLLCTQVAVKCLAPSVLQHVCAVLLCVQVAVQCLAPSVLASRSKSICAGAQPGGAIRSHAI